MKLLIWYYRLRIRWRLRRGQLRQLATEEEHTRRLKRNG